MIRLSKIEKYYGKKQNRFCALQIQRLRIKKGELLAIVGKSGSGKSTLLNVIGIVDHVEQGAYYFEDQPMQLLKEREKALIRNQKIGFVIQSFGLLNDYTVAKNILLPATVLAKTKAVKAQLSARYEELLEALELAALLKKYPDELSGGQQQRVAIARALINDPAVILADEPTGNLDHENSQLVINYLKKENERGKTVCIVTHDLDIAKQCQRVIALKDGQIIQ